MAKVKFFGFEGKQIKKKRSVRVVVQTLVQECQKKDIVWLVL